MTMEGSYMEYRISNHHLKGEHNLHDNDVFDITLMMFATNAEPATERPLDGILGIAPCPSELAEYSFAA